MANATAPESETIHSSEPGETPRHVPFGSSPGLRQLLLVLLVPSALLIPLLPIPWNPARIGLIAALEIFFILIILGLANPTRFAWTWRAVCAMVFAAFVAYLVTELYKNQWHLGSLQRTRGASPANALLGLLAFGLPALKYAITGRLLPRKLKLKLESQ